MDNIVANLVFVLITFGAWLALYKGTNNGER